MYSKLQGIFTFTSVKKKVNGTSILQLYIQNQTLKREFDIYRNQLGAISRNEVRSKLLQMYMFCKVRTTCTVLIVLCLHCLSISVAHCTCVHTDQTLLIALITLTDPYLIAGSDF